MQARAICTIVGVAFALGVTASGWAGTFKWVDDKGLTHYGDSIPPEYKDKANAELNKRGVTVRRTDQALTPDQLRARQDEQVRAKEEEARLKEQKRRDQALLQTFTNENDINLKRDRDLQQVELSIANNRAVLKSAEKRLSDTRTRADGLAKSGRPIPDGLKQDMENDESERARLEGLIGQKRQELDAIRAKYEEYKQRFAELQGGTRPAAGAPASVPATATSNPASVSAARK